MSLANSTDAPSTVNTWLLTPSSANLLAAMTTSTGSGLLVFATSPTLTTPILGTPTSGNLVNCTGYITTGYTLLSIQTFSDTGTWTKPTGCTAVLVELVGGGGGAGGVSSAATATIQGGAGGGGGYSRGFFTAGLGATETVTIGAAGTAGSNTGGNGGDGGTTSFGAHCQATGGVGGGGATAGTYGTVGTGGIGSGGFLNYHGGTGGYSAAGSFTTAGGNSVWGTGGNVFFYTGGHAGVDASDFGGGGQGAIADHISGFAGGAGTAGFCIVYNYGNT